MADPFSGTGVYLGGEIGNTANILPFPWFLPNEEAYFSSIILDYARVRILLQKLGQGCLELVGTAKDHYDAAITASILDGSTAVGEATSYLLNLSVDLWLAFGKYGYHAFGKRLWDPKSGLPPFTIGDGSLDLH